MPIMPSKSAHARCWLEMTDPAAASDVDAAAAAPATRTQQQHHSYANLHIERVINGTFSPSSKVLQHISDGPNLTSSALLDPSNPLTIDRPMLITDTPESIGMRVPRGAPMSPRKAAVVEGSPSTSTTTKKKRITRREIGELVGMSIPVTVMDVQTQEEMEGWVMSDLVDYFEDDERLFLDGQGERQAHQAANSAKRTNPSRKATAVSGSSLEGKGPKVLNQISLEFSHTPLIRRTRSPQFVRELDWIDNDWPAKKKKAADYPQVQYYCLTSTAGCYTDFHLDFGGTSVWYSVLSGVKVFLLAPPTKSNLMTYEQWLCQKDQASVFLPDLDGMEDVIKVTLEQDQTLFIPSGWIHAVYTPVDSIVVGGNFLHGLAIGTQLDVHCIETRTKVPQKFRFPNFARINFYAGANYLEKMRSGRIHKDELKDMKRFAEALRSWAPRGDAELDPSRIVAATAAECAKKVGCANAVEMAEMMLEEVARIEKDGIVPQPGRSPPPKKIKLSLKGLSPSTSPPPTAADYAAQEAAKPKKLKLKIGNLASLLKGDSDSDEMNDEKKSASGDDGFRITLSQSTSSVPTANTGKRKIADLESRAPKLDLGDEEWTPGMDGDVTYYTASKPSKSKPKSKPKLKLSTSSSSSVRVATAKPKAPSRASPKPKGKAKGMSARARLSKKMKF